MPWCKSACASSVNTQSDHTGNNIQQSRKRKKKWTLGRWGIFLGSANYWSEIFTSPRTRTVDSVHWATRERARSNVMTLKDAALCLHFHFFPNICTRSWILWKHLEEEQVSSLILHETIENRIVIYKFLSTRMEPTRKPGATDWFTFVPQICKQLHLSWKFEFKLEFQMICLVKVKKTLG